MAALMHNWVFWFFGIIIFLMFVGIALIKDLRWLPAWVVRVVLALLTLVVMLTTQDTERLNKGIDDAKQSKILLIDYTESVNEKDREVVLQQGLKWQAEGANRLLLAYNQHAVWSPEQNGQTVRMQTNGRGLGAVLAKAVSLLGNQPGQIILATDGAFEIDNQLQEALTAMQHNGQGLDILPLKPKYTAQDSYVGVLQTPYFVWQNTSFPVILPLYSANPTSAEPTFKVFLDGREEEIKGERISERYYSFMLPAREEGVLTIEIKAIFQDDKNEENNSSYAVVHVVNAPKIAWVTSEKENVRSLVRDLGAEGLTITLTAPSELSTDIKELQRNKIIVLDNLLSFSLTPDQMNTLIEFVKQGGGLIFIGGKNAYTLGGYKNTPLEPLLPMKLEPPPRPSREPILMLIVMDISGSMRDPIGGKGYITSMMLAQEAAIRTVETLNMEDYLGLVTFATNVDWKVKIQEIRDGVNLRRTQDIISKMIAFGNTNMLAALNEVKYYFIKNSDPLPKYKYILLLSDGKSSDGSLERFIEYSDGLNKKYDLKISTIALGNSADRLVMGEIAKHGKGRYYEVLDPNQLPKIMISESKAARAENVQTGEVSLKVNIPRHPILYSLSEAQLPILNSYNALDSKSDIGSEDILVSDSYGDPILSAWQVGLGRVLAWTSTSTGDWVKDWRSKDVQLTFWTQVLKYGLPSPVEENVLSSFEVNDDELAIEVNLIDTSTDLNAISQAQVVFNDREGKPVTVNLEQSQLGKYIGRIPRPPFGAYKGSVKVHDGNNNLKQYPIAFSINPSQEVMPVDVQQNVQKLEKLAAEGHGRLISWEELVQPQERVIEEPQLSNLLIMKDKLYLLGLLLGLWMVDIAIRRRWLPWV